MQTIYKLIENAAPTDASVLIQGESGTGKELVARAIHQKSLRSGQPFIVINCSAYPATLLESEIFGHKKGSFTDASCDKEGFVSQAREGTLFFDEISEIPPSFQTKLLRFMETRRYISVGDTREQIADVRILAATNKNLLEAIDRKEFRKDLYFRLSILEIHVPPLRERKEDIRALVRDKIKHLRGKKIESCFWEEIFSHDWPGNVRELITVLTRVGILAGRSVTGIQVREILDNGYFKLEGPGKNPETQELLNKLSRGGNFWQAVWQPFIRRDISRATMKEILKTCYLASSMSFVRMLDRLNIAAADYHSLMSLMRKYRIDPRT